MIAPPPVILSAAKDLFTPFARSATRVIVLLLVLTQPACAGNGQPKTTGQAGTLWDPFLDTLQMRTLRYFLETTPEKTGLAPDRWPSKSPSSIAAAGFALTCLPVAVERGQIARAEAASRVLSALRFFMSIPQSSAADGAGGYQGLFYHFLQPEDGTRTWSCELSTIDTGLLMMGVLFCESYFNEERRGEAEIRALADSLYRRVDWKWAMDDTTGILMGWTPEQGYHELTWHGYNEALFLYILALGSPTHPVPVSAWDHWTSSYSWGSNYGYEYLQFAPLFGHQFTQCWIDLRNLRDAYMRGRGIDYFENSRRATYSQRQFVIENRMKWRGYSDTLWGLTACDGPRDTSFEVDGTPRRFIGYGARGTSIAWTNDDGTIAPAAPGGSLPFAPEICIPALKTMRRTYSSSLWTGLGFTDAFNLTYVTPATPGGWFDIDYLGIDQGPIALMIENLRDGFVWKIMGTNPYVVRGLRRAGFSGGWLDQSGR